MSDLNARAFVKRQGRLIPADVMSDELLAKIPEGKTVLVSVRTHRNTRQHRLLFAMLRKVVENTDQWSDEKILLDDLKLATGLFETRVSALTKMPYPVPASISFASMPQERFEQWFRKAMEKCAEVLGCSVEDLMSEVTNLVGFERSQEFAA